MLTLNDYQNKAACTSGDVSQEAGLISLLKFLGMDAPAASCLAAELAGKQLEDDGVLPGRLIVATLGLTGEAGEFADAIKKTARHGHALDKDKLIDELGDIQWYVAEAASALGVSLESVALRNLDKLQRRYPRGFTQEASVNRIA